MPLTWVIDHQARMVVATGADTLRLEDFDAAMDELARPATLSYRKLVDLTHCSSSLGTADMLDLSSRIRGYSSMSALGALAIVAISDENYRQARLFEALDGTDATAAAFYRELVEAEARHRGVYLDIAAAIATPDAVGRRWDTLAACEAAAVALPFEPRLHGGAGAAAGDGADGRG